MEDATMEQDQPDTAKRKMEQMASRDTKPKRQRKTKSTAVKDENSDSSETPHDIDPTSWPPEFKQLEQVFQSLNTVYTFCCTRKHFATTFESIKASVESLTRRQLTIEDIVCVKALLPESITFEYVDKDALEINVDPSGYMNNKLTRDIFELKEAATSVLHFAFVDGELRPIMNRTKGVVADKRDLKLPEFSATSMTNLIKKRNDKFKKAVHKHLRTCLTQGLDPWTHLASLSSRYFPLKDAMEDPPLLSQSSSAAIPNGESATFSMKELIQELQNAEDYRDQIVPNGHRTIPEHPAQYGTLSRLLSPSLQSSLETSRGITNLYSHQANAINALWSSHNVIVSTSTASGKSLIYQLPVLDALERDRDVRALYIFPTKALAQDQKKSLVGLLGCIDGLQDIVVETFDGDTPQKDRNWIRENASVIFTNPDTLHVTILPNEEKWRTFLRNLKYIVVDELHVYNGLFGSHVALIMRRLRRLCAAVGNRRNLQFISCTATLPNAKEHMKAIFGLNDVTLIDEDGSPAGKKEFILWNAPLVDPDDRGAGRTSTISETSKLLVFLINRGIRTIAFCKIRKLCDILLRSVRAELRAQQLEHLSDKVMSYRGGYTAQDRRKIEQAMFNGDLLGIIATSALELGVDIGTLDAVLIVGFPYTIAAMRQQSGRAGRRKKDSLTIYIADPFPVDQHFMNHPDELFSKPNLEAQIDLENPLVLEGHLQCAAYEMPLQPNDDQYFGNQMIDIAEQRMVKDDGGYYHCHPRFHPHPWKHVSIRDIEDDTYVIVDVTNQKNIVLEELEASRTLFTVYEGAIYMHQGNTYLVKELDIDKKIASVILVNVEWTTRQRDFTNVDPVETRAIRQISGSSCSAFYGDILVTMVVFGYFKVDSKNNVIDAVDVDNPPVLIHTRGMWLDVPAKALEILTVKKYNIAGSIHAAEHAVLSLLPNVVVTSPGDVRTECKAPQKEYAKRETQRKRPARLILYDAVGKGGGAGISSKAFDFVDLLLHQAVDRVESCGCESGCPECITSSVCHEGNVVSSKIGAGVILKSFLNMEIDVDNLPEGNEEGISIETVIAVNDVVKEADNVIRYG